MRRDRRTTVAVQTLCSAGAEVLNLMEGRVARVIAFLTLAFAAPTLAQQAPPSGCDAPESHQLDFWVGKWEVHPTKSTNIVAHSLIEKRYMGCAVRENWMPVGRELTGGGGSL